MNSLYGDLPAAKDGASDVVIEAETSTAKNTEIQSGRHAGVEKVRESGPIKPSYIRPVSIKRSSNQEQYHAPSAPQMKHNPSISIPDLFNGDAYDPRRPHGWEELWKQWQFLNTLS